MRLLILTLICLLLSGCLIGNVKQGPIDTTNTKTGIVVLSVSQTNGWFKDVRSIVYINGPKEGHIMSRNELIPTSHIYTRSDFSDSMGKLNVLELPIGKYALVNWSVSSSYFKFTATEDSQPTPIEFEVRAGEIVYLGNIHFQLIEGSNVIGIPGLADIELPIISNKFERDIAIFNDRYQTLDPIKNSSLNIVWDYRNPIGRKKGTALQPSQNEVPINKELVPIQPYTAPLSTYK